MSIEGTRGQEPDRSVETIDQLEHLRAMQCDTVQGYLFSGPTTASDIHAMAREEKALIRQSGPAPERPYPARSKVSDETSMPMSRHNGE